MTDTNNLHFGDGFLNADVGSNLWLENGDQIIGVHNTVDECVDGANDECLAS